MAVALITGASRGLRACGRTLPRPRRVGARPRRPRAVAPLEPSPAELVQRTLTVVAGAIPGDVTDPAHRDALVAAAEDLGGLDLLVNNASVLGPSPQPALADVPDSTCCARCTRSNVVAPLALVQHALPLLRSAHGVVVNITSDAGASSRTKAGAATARRRPRSNSGATSSAPRNPTCACTRSIPATCARRCTRKRSPARTSPIARFPSRSCRRSVALLRRATRRVVGTRVSGAGPVMATRCREATAPAEARGITRDAVRMMVAYRSDLRVVHAHAHDLPQYLDEGDLVVVNTSGTLAAAVDALGEDGTPLVVHLSQQLPAGLWLVELRRPDGGATATVVRRSRRGTTLRLVGGGDVRLATRFEHVAAVVDRDARSARAGAHVPRGARPPDPLRLRRRATGRSTCTRTCTRASPAARRCRARVARSRPS